MERLQFPLLLFLELLVLALLALAAAGPNVRTTTSGHPLVVVLDTSYSMNAALPNEKSPQTQAIETMEKFFDTNVDFPVQFVTAGSQSATFGQRVRTQSEAKALLRQWRCDAPTDSITQAIVFAATISPPDSRIVVLTDRIPAEPFAAGRVKWYAFGKPQNNMAIVHANRTQQGERDRLLLEIANRSPSPQQMNLVIRDDKRNVIVHETSQLLSAGELFRLRSTVPSGVEILDVRLSDDALAIDNKIQLLPPSKRQVRVQVSDAPMEMREPLKRAIEASGIGRVVTDMPELVFVDAVSVQLAENVGSTNTSSDTGNNSRSENKNNAIWTVRIYTGAEASEPIVGPFILDRTSPMAGGVSLDGVVWSVPAELTEKPLAGQALIAAATVPLFTEQTLRNGTKMFHFAIQSKLSTLTTQPAFPALIWNLLQYRNRNNVGIATPNVKLGTSILFTAPSDERTVNVATPDGLYYTIPVRGGMASFGTTQCGLHTITAGTEQFQFSVGTLSLEESDLTNTSSGTFGSWIDDETIRNDYDSLVWLLLIASLVVLAIHLALLKIQMRSRD
jgi:hypothetical protein